MAELALDKNALKAQIRQKLQEKILASKKPTEPDYSVGGFFSNIGSEAGQIVRGIGSLLGMAGNAVIHPIETAQFITSPEFPQALKQVGSAVVESYKGYKEPLKKLYNEPIGVVTDALTVLSLGGYGVTKLGTAAKIPEITKTGEVITKISKPITLTKELAKTGISKLPGGPEFLTALEQRAKTAEVISKTQQAHLIERNKAIQGIDDIVKTLTPEEKQTLIPFVEKRITLSFEPSENFNKAVNLTQKLATQREELLLKTGKLTPEQITARKWQPVLKQLYGDKLEQKIDIEIPDNVKETIGTVFSEMDVAEAGKRFAYQDPFSADLIFKGSKSTFPEWMPSELRQKKLFNSVQDKLLSGEEKFLTGEQRVIDVMREEVAKRTDIPMESITTKMLAGQMETIKIEKTIPKLIEETKQLLGFADDPIYVQHIFDDKPKKFTDFFVNTAPVKNWKPGFLKRSFGVKGYSVDPDSVLKWEVAQTLKYKNNIDLLEKVKNLDFVEPLDNIKNIKPGYKVFAPDGYIRFYQGTIDLVKEFTNKLKKTGQMNEVGDIWDNLKDAIDSSLLETKYLGVTSRVKLYQVPDASAKVLQAYAKATNPYVRLFWDKPVDAFRFLALALTPRWLVNNVVGNTMMSIIAGDPFTPAGYLTYRMAKAEGLIPDDVFSGFYHSEKLMTGKLGRAAETKVGAIMKAAGEGLSELPVIKQVKQLGEGSYRINATTDDFFRGAHFINIATREARKKALQETGEKLNKTIELLKYAQQDPEILAKAINSVEDFFYGAGQLSNFERRYVRRFLPFYSWYKFITLYGLRLPLNHPGRFEIIGNLAKTFYDITGQNELPNYLKGSVPIGETKEGDIYYLRTSGANPFSLLEDIATQGVSQTALSSLTPPIKTAVERITGREAFTGRTFTSKNIIEAYGGRLYTFNQKTGKTEEVEAKVKPALLEHLLRNFVPQYQLMEQAIVGGAQTYTAAGLPSLITGKGVKTSPITGEPKKPTGALQKLKLRALGLLGIPVSLRTPEQQQTEQESLQRATTQIIGQEVPFMSSQFKKNLKDALKQKILNDVQNRSIIEGIF